MKKIILFFLGFVACGTLFAPALSYAQVQDPTVVKLVNPIGGTKEKPEGTIEIPEILGGILTKALGVMGSAALLMFVIGGAMWLTSAGNSERVQKGTETMVWAAIGVLIIFSSYAILRLVLGGIGAEGLENSSQQTSGDPAATSDTKGADWCFLIDSQSCAAGNGSPCSSGLGFKTQEECENFPFHCIPGEAGPKAYCEQFFNNKKKCENKGLCTYESKGGADNCFPSGNVANICIQAKDKQKCQAVAKVEVLSVCVWIKVEQLDANGF